MRTWISALALIAGCADTGVFNDGQPGLQDGGMDRRLLPYDIVRAAVDRGGERA